MKTENKNPLHTKPSWHSFFDASDQTMKLSFTEDIADCDIEHYLQMVRAMVHFMPVKTLMINDDKIKNNPLGLDWKIIETNWENLCNNGGKKIIVIHQSKLPSYLKETYVNAIKSYGIPIELEFRSTEKSTLISHKTKQPAC